MTQLFPDIEIARSQNFATVRLFGSFATNDTSGFQFNVASVQGVEASRCIIRTKGAGDALSLVECQTIVQRSDKSTLSAREQNMASAAYTRLAANDSATKISFLINGTGVSDIIAVSCKIYRVGGTAADGVSEYSAIGGATKYQGSDFDSLPTLSTSAALIVFGNIALGEISLVEAADAPANGDKAIIEFTILQ